MGKSTHNSGTEKKMPLKRTLLVLTLLAAGSALSAASFACILDVYGEVSLTRQGKALPARKYETLLPGTRVTLGESGVMALLLKNGNKLQLDGKSDLLVEADGIKPLNDHTRRLLAATAPVYRYNPAASRGGSDALRHDLAVIDKQLGASPLLHALARTDVMLYHGFLALAEKEYKKYQALLAAQNK